MMTTQEPTALAGSEAASAERLAAMPATRVVVPSLNGLRALSIIIVFLSHTVNDRLFPGGFGVRVFFLISGFLITRLMFVEWKSKGAIALGNFYIRRLLRLYPVVLAFTVVVIGVDLAVSPAAIHWGQPLSALLYFANYYYSGLNQAGQTEGTMPFLILWSLSVEEHFYLVFPLFFVALRADARRLAAACCGVLAICLMLRLGVAAARPDLVSSFTFYYQTQYQLDAIGFGVLLAALCEYEVGRAILRRLLGPTAIGLALVLLVAGFAIRNGYFRETIRYSMLSAAVLVGVANVLFSERFGPVQAVLNTRAMDWIGRLSYSIYVWHLLPDLVIDIQAGPLWLEFLPYLAATMTLACASHYLIERPMSLLRHRFGSVAPQRALN